MVLALAVTMSFATASYGVEINGVSQPLRAIDVRYWNRSLPPTEPPSAAYGPPASALFHPGDEVGPVIYGSGEASGLYSGPGYEWQYGNSAMFPIDSILLVFSSKTALSPDDQIQFTLNRLTGGSFSESLTENDFFTSGAAGFPDFIAGLDQETVLGIDFPSAYHAAVRVGLTLGANGEQMGNLQVTTPVDMRVDAFGIAYLPLASHGTPTVANGSGISVPLPAPASVFRIVNNNPNSGSVGFTGAMTVNQVPDGGMTAILLGCSMVMMAGFAACRRSRS